jgi:hypothetical protein
VFHSGNSHRASGVLRSLSVLIVLAGGAIVPGACYPPEGGRASEAGQENQERLLKLKAFDVCRQFVEQQLKAPSTADFASATAPGVEIDSLGADQFEVIAFVDAQNSFGAKLRNPYICVVQHVSGDSFRLLRLDFDSMEREADRRIADEVQRQEREAERERRQFEAEVQARSQEEERAEAERQGEERRRREELLRAQRGARMPGWHPIYLRELSTLRPAIGAVTEAWSGGSRGIDECTALQARLTGVTRGELLAAPDPAVASQLDRMLNAFERGARLCGAGQRYGAEEEFKVAAREWGSVAELLRGYGLQP